MEAIEEIINIDDESVLTDTKTYIRKPRKSVIQLHPTAPLEGFMTGDEFERRVKEELKQLYKKHGLL